MLDTTPVVVVLGQSGPIVLTGGPGVNRYCRLVILGSIYRLVVPTHGANRLVIIGLKRFCELVVLKRGRETGRDSTGMWLWGSAGWWSSVPGDDGGDADAGWSVLASVER